MPDFDRFSNEAALASSVRTVFDELLLQVEGRRPPVWDDFARGIQKSFDDELLAVYVVVFLMMADGLDPLVASSTGSSWSRARSMEIASELTTNVRREIANGRDPSAVLSDSRISVLSATEITRAISKGQTDARARRAAEADPEARSRGTRSTDPAGASGGGPGAGGRVPSPLSPLDVGDGLVPIWTTARDDRVCPICGPLDGRRYEIWRETFPSGPPAHPNCRCGLIYVEA